MRTPSAISAVSHRTRSCSSSGTNRPSASMRAGSRACWSSISASSPRASGSVGGERELAGEADRLAGQVVPARVPGVVHERQHAKHDRQITGLGGAAAAHRPLGATDPLRHRRLRNEERVGDLASAQPSDGTQRQRHLRRRREVGVAAAEQQRACRRPARWRPGRARARVASSRRRRADSLRRASTRRRMATVVSHARGSRGGCSGQTRSASSIASCTASSAAAKSSPRRTNPASTCGARDRTTCRRRPVVHRPLSRRRQAITSRTSIHS